MKIEMYTAGVRILNFYFLLFFFVFSHVDTHFTSCLRLGFVTAAMLFVFLNKFYLGNCGDQITQLDIWTGACKEVGLEA